jgi:hypothetical protein
MTHIGMAPSKAAMRGVSAHSIDSIDLAVSHFVHEELCPALKEV